MRERGLAVSVEAAVLLPVLLLFVGLVVSVARVAVTEQHVGAAAAAGARAASVARSLTERDEAGRSAVVAALAERGVGCVDTAVTHQVARDRSSTRVRCTVSLADVSLPLVPGSFVVEAERTSPIDPLRGR